MDRESTCETLEGAIRLANADQADETDEYSISELNGENFFSTLKKYPPRIGKKGKVKKYRKGAVRYESNATKLFQMKTKINKRGTKQYLLITVNKIKN